MENEATGQEGQENTSSEQVVEESPVEQEARVQGWVPKEEFDGEAHKWVEAAEFVRRGELFRKIDTQNREIKDVRKTLAALKEHYTKVEEASFNRALAALKAEKVAAQKDGEFEHALRLDDEIKRVEIEKEALQDAIPDIPRDEPVHPEVAQWIERNTWYKTNVRMKAVADTIGQELASKGVSGPAILKAIDIEIRKEFPTKFTNPNRDKPSAVEGGSIKSGNTKSSFQLTADQTRIMERLVRDKVLTKEQYIKDLRDQN